MSTAEKRRQNVVNTVIGLAESNGYRVTFEHDGCYVIDRVTDWQYGKIEWAELLRAYDAGEYRNDGFIDLELLILNQGGEFGGVV